MALVKWTPFRDLMTIQDQINRLFEDSLQRTDEKRLMAPSWQPLVDIYEDGQAIIIKAELPEVDEKDIQLNIENNTLTIKGERKLEQEEKKDNYHRVERFYGSFTRSFDLPTTVDQDGIKASYDKGVLKITLPKKEEVKPKKVQIQVQ
ncbi:MAG: Hsp20/alpha crystallin family protein [Deltaproteobacteria bacterium]|nr:Hsp20/alpha crystallin family protein [Candidatus Anaeroferrophillus wilburensis]MBN2888935.1 Hsp20/alpha crystallin family protein [Deltaproteobacteria bacterium]